MRLRRGTLMSTTLAFMGVLLIPASVEAYLGPGGVVSGIGAFIALVAAVVASIFGFLWFPLKRLLRRLRRETGVPKEELHTASSATTSE